jgi:hypothetical protein
MSKRRDCKRRKFIVREALTKREQEQRFANMRKKRAREKKKEMMEREHWKKKNPPLPFSGNE